MDFSQLGFRERDHLQEWLAANPQALGEDLLIIQKEFDGFADTRERLDLLALDKAGNLVVIENKLDDSGRDVVWQALKYVSYCSSLSKRQIATIYQTYLDKLGPGENAEIKLTEFFGGVEFDDLILNSGQGQRIILVAANFRKEVTSTALWLRSHRIDLRCVRATAYSLGESLFLSLDQIIPVKEAEEYMISINQKEEQEREDKSGSPNRIRVRRAFWEQFLPQLHKSGTRAFADAVPGPHRYLREALPGRGLFVVLEFKQHELEVRLVFRGKSGLAVYERLDVAGLRNRLGTEIEDIDVRGKARKLSIRNRVSAFDEANWPTCNQWLISTLINLLNAARPAFDELSISIP
ncbi:DUF4268 domain-containing protein [Gilvimarinus sp. F26214L]|uniref:DUF4268 domain-containing protein n=1 Tax=Gilvimarinus sp. DZF01 TaxID=3461371 RepID=UPI0040454E6D